jgi:hypothetical protein
MFIYCKILFPDGVITIKVLLELVYYLIAYILPMTLQLFIDFFSLWCMEIMQSLLSKCTLALFDSFKIMEFQNLKN